MSTYYSYYLFKKDPAKEHYEYVGPYKKKDGKYSIVPFVEYSGSFDYGFYESLSFMGHITPADCKSNGLKEFFFEDDEIGIDDWYSQSDFAHVVSYRSLSLEPVSGKLVYISKELKRAFDLNGYDKDPDFMEYSLDYDQIITESEYERLSDEKKKEWFPYILEHDFNASRWNNELLNATNNWLDNSCQWFKEEEKNQLVYIVTVG